MKLQSLKHQQLQALTEKLRGLRESEGIRTVLAYFDHVEAESMELLAATNASDVGAVGRAQGAIMAVRLVRKACTEEPRTVQSIESNQAKA